MSKVYNLALIGFGGVNRALVSIIQSHNAALGKNHGFRLQVVAVSDSWLGSAHSSDGLALNALAQLPAEQGALSALPGGEAEANNRTLIEHPAVDIVCEATVTNPEDGQPALDYCQWALQAGKHVTTTNKGPVAFAGETLQTLAREQGLGFAFEGTVMSGTPVIRYARQTLSGCTIEGFEGILNGTANYVLGQVERGASFAEAIKDAQAKGYAEANPDADLQGSDVQLKVVILANTLLGQALLPSQLDCTGIAGLSETQVREAAAQGQHWKLIGKGQRRVDGSVAVSVAPALLDQTHPLCGIHGPTNALMFSTDLLGDVMVAGPGAGRIETGFALLSDIIAIAAAEQGAEQHGQQGEQAQASGDKTAVVEDCPHV